MASTISESVLTAEELAELPEPRDAGKVELVRGRVSIEMPVSGKHGERQVTIAQALRAFAHPRGIGHVGVETGFILARDPDSVLAPDVSVVPGSRLPSGKLPEVGFIEAAPSLAIEVISPNDREGERSQKQGSTWTPVSTACGWYRRRGGRCWSSRPVVMSRPWGSATSSPAATPGSRLRGSNCRSMRSSSSS